MGLMAWGAQALQQYGPAIAKQIQGAMSRPQGFVNRGPGRSPYNRPSDDPGYRPRRRAGLSARDIKGAQKVARIVTMFGFKPKMKKRKKGR